MTLPEYIDPTSKFISLSKCEASHRLIRAQQDATALLQYYQNHAVPQKFNAGVIVASIAVSFLGSFYRPSIDIVRLDRSAGCTGILTLRRNLTLPRIGSYTTLILLAKRTATKGWRNIGYLVLAAITMSSGKTELPDLSSFLNVAKQSA